jgi:hypothetical protein
MLLMAERERGEFQSAVKRERIRVGEVGRDTEAEMRKLHIGGIAALAWAMMTMTIGVNEARAEPPELMAYYQSKTPFIVCNTREEIMQVVNSVKTNKLEETMAAFSKQADANHEPACVYGDIGAIVFGASEHVGLVVDSERAINVWVSHVGNRRGDFYLLWGEIGKDTPV